MEESIVSAVLNSNRLDSLSISLRLLRVMLSALLIYAVAAEPLITGFWQLLLSVLAVYTFITGVNGRDPLLALLRHNNRQRSEHTLDFVARLECLSIGSICFAAGMFNQFHNSIVFLLLPFLGIYPIVLCIIRHDLLGYLLQSYRR